jgi:uncharacterized protein YbjT (DUF2867 family)
MTVTVFGATGGIGRHVLHQLLADGTDVVAYVRNPGKLGQRDPHLRVVQGELADLEAITAAVAGSDAVISTLGPSLQRGATGTPITEGTRHIVAAMQETGVCRYVGLATPSVPDVRDRPTLKARILPVMARLAFPNALRELIGMTSAVTESDLDWTIARITAPNDKPASGRIRAGFLGVDKVGSVMTRADIAAFMVAQLSDATYSRAAPAISN